MFCTTMPSLSVLTLVRFTHHCSSCALELLRCVFFNISSDFLCLSFVESLVMKHLRSDKDRNYIPFDLVTDLTEQLDSARRETLANSGEHELDVGSGRNHSGQRAPTACSQCICGRWREEDVPRL